MPNWTTNIIKLTGSEKDITDIQKLIFSVEDGEISFDFNKVIPMPIELENTQCPEIIVTQEEYDSWEPKNEYDHRGITQEMSDSLIEKYGFNNWYYWRTENWGTKWNSEGTQIINSTSSNLEFSFQTAWSHPEVVISKLNDMFPQVKFYHEAQHEGGFGGHIAEFNPSTQSWSFIETHEITVGENEDGNIIELTYNDDTDEYVDSNGNVYEDYYYEFVPVNNLLITEMN
jgi:hypothetical protein